jgi:hypothetical protein
MHSSWLARTPDLLAAGTVLAENEFLKVTFSPFQFKISLQFYV